MCFLQQSQHHVTAIDDSRVYPGWINLCIIGLDRLGRIRNEILLPESNAVYILVEQQDETTKTGKWQFRGIRNGCFRLVKRRMTCIEIETPGYEIDHDLK